MDRLGEMLGLTVVHVGIPAGLIREIARDERRSVEEVARQQRYDALRSVAGDLGPGKPALIALAHHGQDQLETILMRVCGGRSPLEPISMPLTRVLGPEAPDGAVFRVVRPLLGVPRSVIDEYVSANGLPVFHDPSNDDRRYLRNAVRAVVIPALENVFGSEAPIRAAAQFARDLEGLQNAVEELVPRGAAGEIRNSVWSADRERFEALPGAAREIVLRRALYRIAETTRLPFSPFRSALYRKQDVTAAGVSLHWARSVVEVRRDIVRTGTKGYLYTIDKEATIRFVGYGPGVQVRPGAAERTGTPEFRRRWTIGPLTAPVVVRQRRSSDPSRATGDAPILEDRSGYAAILDRTGPLCLRDGIECIQDNDTVRADHIVLSVEYEGMNAERR